MVMRTYSIVGPVETMAVGIFRSEDQARAWLEAWMASNRGGKWSNLRLVDVSVGEVLWSYCVR